MTYKNPALTVDIALFSIIKNNLELLLIKRKNPPFQDKWALPGGFVDYEEEIETAAKRELEEETGIKNIELQQFRTFGKPGRDPRGRTVSIVYYAVVNSENLKIQADTDASDVEWFNIKNLPGLAFDHDEIIKFTLKNFRQKLENTPVVKPIMPKEFNMTELHKVYEIILDKQLDAKNFESEIIQTGLLERTEPSLHKFKDNVEFTGRFLNFKK